jgi:hypothetical protein
MSHSSFSWLWSSLIIAAILAASVAVFIVVDVFLIRLILAIFAVSFVLAIVFHPDFVLRRIGAGLISAGLLPTGVEFAGRIVWGDAATTATLGTWLGLKIDGPPSWLVLLAGLTLLVLEPLLRTIRELRGQPVVPSPPVRNLDRIEWDREVSMFLLSARFQLTKKAGLPLLIYGARATALTPLSSATIRAEQGFFASSPSIPNALDEASEGSPVDVTGMTTIDCQAHVIVKDRLAAWAHRNGNWRWLRFAARSLVCRYVGARVTVIANTGAVASSVLFRADPSRN